MAIITLAEFKAYRSITVTTYDTILTNMIASAEALISRLTGVRYGATVYTDEPYDGNGSDILQLRNFPASVSTITLLSDTGEETLLVIDIDFRQNVLTGQVSRIGAEVGRFVWDGFNTNYTEVAQWDVYPQWPKGFQNILVSYTGSTAPADMKQVMYEYVNMLFSPIQDGGADPTLTSETLGDYSYDRESSQDGRDTTMQWLMSRLVPFKLGANF